MTETAPTTRDETHVTREQAAKGDRVDTGTGVDAGRGGRAGHLRRFLSFAGLCLAGLLLAGCPHGGEQIQLTVNTCLSCHGGSGIEQIHTLFALTCVQCHGGDDTQTEKAGAHVLRPANFGTFPLVAGTHRLDTPGTPFEKRGPRPYRQDDPTNSDHSDPAILAYRRFLNPGDLLVAQQSCGASGCHGEIVERVTRSLHATMAGFMSGVFYANGHPGASEGRVTDFVGNATDRRDADKFAKLAILLPRGQPIVDPNFDPSIPGTLPSITREVPRNDEARRLAKKSDSLGMMTFYVQTDCSRCHLYTEGSKAPGDYRSQGCSGCHVLYRLEGFSETNDPVIPRNETDHPLKHRMVRFPPDEQCAHCHNRGARHTQEFIGFRERPQGDFALPQFRILNEHNQNPRVEDPESGGRRGGFYPGSARAGEPGGGLFFRPGDRLFGRPYDPSQFGADIVRGFDTQSVWRRVIRPGRNPFFVTDENRANTFDETPQELHGERGFACIDCHTRREMHGDGHIYTDRFHKVEIKCESCHGSASEVTNLRTLAGNPVRGLFQNPDGSFSLRLASTGEVRSVPQIKTIIDSSRNPNNIDGHLPHTRLECATCHAKWNNQCISCHMITAYDSRDAGGFFQRSYMDNVVRNATQGQPRWITTFDQLILGINRLGKIQNFHVSGQATLFANKLVGGTGAEANLAEGNFLEFSRCAGGANDRGLCENNSDCPGGTCTPFQCVNVPPGITLPPIPAALSRSDAPGTPQAEGQCKVCTAGTRVGSNCSLDFDCGSGGRCEGGTLALPPPTNSRVCFGGSNDGQPCTFDPNNPTDPLNQCPGGSCGVRMSNFIFTTIDNGLHLPALPLNPIFPHTTRKIPRNCDSCHQKPGGTEVDAELMFKALGMGSGAGRTPRIPSTTRVLDPNDPRGFRDIRIDRRVRIFTNNKGDLSFTNPATGLPVGNGEEISINFDQFIDVEFDAAGNVVRITQLRPTTHVGTGPLDRTAIEKVIRTVVPPQIPSEAGP